MKAVIVALTCALLVTSSLAQQGGQAAPPPGSAPPPGQSPPPPTTPVSSPTSAPTQTATPTARPPVTPPGPSPPTPAPTARPPTTGPTAAPTTRPPTTAPTTAPTTTPTSTPTRAPGTPPTPSTTGGGAAGGAGGSGGSPSGPASGITDADVLYFAYNLEVFEAQFYSCAATGQTIAANLLGGGGQVSGCPRGQLTSNVATYAAELAREETAHVALLQRALQSVGVNPVAPRVDITTAFNSAAGAALNNPNPQPVFDPYANDFFFLHAAFLFEDLGVSAYLGALNSINNASYRLTGAQIGATEAYHASLIRTLLFQTIDQVPAYNLTVRQITDAITSTLNTLATQPQQKYALYNQQGSAISNVDSNGLAPAARIPEQITRVVTLGAAAGQGGGFFPDNLTGRIRN